MCEMCQTVSTRHLCPELCCLTYLCETCWFDVHRRRGLLTHRPMVKAKPGIPLANISNHIALCCSNYVSRSNQRQCRCSKLQICQLHVSCTLWIVAERRTSFFRSNILLPFVKLVWANSVALWCFWKTAYTEHWCTKSFPGSFISSRCFLHVRTPS